MSVPLAGAAAGADALAPGDGGPTRLRGLAMPTDAVLQRWAGLRQDEAGPAAEHPSTTSPDADAVADDDGPAMRADPGHAGSFIEPAGHGRMAAPAAQAAVAPQAPLLAAPPRAALNLPAAEPGHQDARVAMQLSALRQRHAQHLAGPLAGTTTSAPAVDADPARWGPGIERPEGAPRPDLWPESARADGQTVPVRQDSATTEPLQALIERCCTRLWVSDDDAGRTSGVLLDLGRWWPGCTLELARSAGALQVTLRGAEPARRAQLASSLGTLGDDLAQRLGCEVVVAVADGPADEHEPGRRPRR